MEIDFNLLRKTERVHYDDPTCGILVDIFQNGNHWHAIAFAERAEWYCQNGFGDTKEEALKAAILGVLDLVKDVD